jgi:DNA-binding NarL/FixJ family response regulator
MIRPSPTACAKTRQRPAALLRLRRSMAKGESTARLARELGRSRQQVHTWRHRVQANLNATAPTDMRHGTAVDADERYENVGEKRTPLAIRALRHAAAPGSAGGTGSTIMTDLRSSV